VRLANLLAVLVPDLQLAHMGMVSLPDQPPSAAAIVPTELPAGLLEEDSKGALANCWLCGRGVAWVATANSACAGRPCHSGRACGWDKSR
jgi:hypothetical protein